MTIVICFGQFGPYHHARVAAFQRLLLKVAVKMIHWSPVQCIPLQIASSSTTYEWIVNPVEVGSDVTETRCEGLRTLCRGAEEEASPLEIFFRARNLFRKENVRFAFLPSYSPARYFALFAAAKSLGIRTVMMNESHSGTERATGWRKWIKRQILNHFDAALVGGEPHRRHFSSLGMSIDKIFTGYDAVDNDFFTALSDKVRAKTNKTELTKSIALQPHPNLSENTESINSRITYALPDRYFLSLGRMVKKKNLTVLVEAYANYCARSGLETVDVPKQAPVSLVFVGSGELEGSLRDQARKLGLRVVDMHGLSVFQKSKDPPNTESGTLSFNDSYEAEKPNVEDRNSISLAHRGETFGTVYFYGFRQIKENAIFYALAEAFVLPSLYEEWGLVVNEAMASSLPVIVSRTAGCAEDLLQGTPHGATLGSLMSDLSSDPYEFILKECQNGYLFDATSAEALTKALQLIAHSEQRRSFMGKQSREIIEEFSCENFARQALRAVQAAGF
jgi:1,2-diacylglycerol 3-alpha-glucosyltransferase